MVKKQFGLLGKKLSHSFSKKYFTEIFDNEHINAVYDLYEVASASELEHFFNTHQSICGLNVTVPYKESTIPFLDSLSEEAQEIKAVNVIRFEYDGTKTGYNTDTTAFRQSLLNTLSGTHISIHSALICGTGGAAKAVAYALNSLNIPYLFVSRSLKSTNTDTILYTDLSKELLTSHSLIVNATPLGMYPDVDAAPDIPYEFLSDKNLCFDLTYNPAVTRFLQLARSYGAHTRNGLEMLHLQADESRKIWKI